MSRAYSQDLRDRVLAASAEGLRTETLSYRLRFRPGFTFEKSDNQWKNRHAGAWRLCSTPDDYAELFRDSGNSVAESFLRRTKWAEYELGYL